MKMSIYKIISTAAAGCMVIAGIVYLIAGEAMLLWVLPLFCVLLAIMGIANALDLKKKEITDFPAYIPAICFGVLSLAVTAATVYWYVRIR